MNEMELKFLSRSENVILARNAVAAFILPLNPSLAELSDVKTAVSEAVTNAIVHGYGGKEGWIVLRCRTEKKCLHIEISDSGKGIDDVERAQQPFYTTASEEERISAHPQYLPVKEHSETVPEQRRGIRRFVSACEHGIFKGDRGL